MSLVLQNKLRFPITSIDRLTARPRLVGIGDASTEKASRLSRFIASVSPLEEYTLIIDDPPWSETEDEAWTEAKNKLRCELINRKYAGSLTPVQARELDRLQALMLRHRQLNAPLPLEDARRLYKKLLAEVNQSPAPTDL